MKIKKILLYTAASIGVCLAIFLLRKRVYGPLFALADAFSVSGFFTLLFAFFSRFVAAGAFDGFAYAARLALAGWFPIKMQTYQMFKENRKENKTNSKPDREGVCVGGIFFMIGLILCVLSL